MSLAAIAVIAVLLLVAGKFCFVSVPAKYYAVFDLFGRRWRARPEGLWFSLPGENYKLYSRELARAEVSVKTTSRDLLSITLRGAVKFIPDFQLIMRYDEAIKELAKGLADAIENELGVLAGTKDAKDFVFHRRALSLIINCRLRFKEMPHLHPELFGEEKADIALEERLDFYARNAEKIETLLEKENQHPNDRSRTEEIYGVDVLIFDLKDPEYSPATSAVFESLKQAEAQLAAAQKKLELVKLYKETGVSPLEAVDAAQVALGEAKKIVHSIHGQPVKVEIGR